MLMRDALTKMSEAATNATTSICWAAAEVSCAGPSNRSPYPHTTHIKTLISQPVRSCADPALVLHGATHLLLEPEEAQDPQQLDHLHRPARRWKQQNMLSCFIKKEQGTMDGVLYLRKMKPKWSFVPWHRRMNASISSGSSDATSIKDELLKMK